MEEKIKIIIADDNLDLADVIKDFILTKRSDLFDVVFIAEDGVQAIEAVKKYCPDILILDIIMPLLDGRSVLQRLKLIELNKVPKIFIISSIKDDYIIQNILNMGVDYYMAKPFDFNAFLDALISISYLDNICLNNINLNKTSENININVKIIERVIYKSGVPTHTKGYKFLKTAVLEILKNESILDSTTSELYPYIARKHFTSTSNVEKSIRAAINTACYRGLDTELNSLIRNNKKISNKQFISLLVEKVKVE